MNGFIQDSDGNNSSKRLIGFISFGAMIVLAGLEVIFPEYQVNEYVFEGFQWTVAVTILGAASEKIVRRSAK